MSVLRDLRVLAVHRGFRRLLAVRLVSQTGDGMFQAGLATLFFFAPERLTTAADVAAAFAVLLLPFTIVGPWAGVLLDRWSRRQVLLVGNAVRVGLTLALAALVVTGGVGPAVYVLTLVTLSVNRFLLSALSAGLPRVVPAGKLLMANTVSPTLGAVAAGVGAAAGVGLRIAGGGGGALDGAVLGAAALLFAAAAALALRLGRDQLGPDRAAAVPLRTAAGQIARGLVAGARHVAARRTPGFALLAVGMHRFAYGATFIATLLIARNVLADPRDADAGLAAFGAVGAALLVGFAAAVVLTPLAHERVSTGTWVVVCLVVGALSQVALALGTSRAGVLAAAALLGLGSQGAKIAVDTIVQRDSHDAFRGRVFALYDVTYNAMFVAAAALAAVALPDTGWSPAVALGLAVAYLVVAAVVRAGLRRPAPEAPEVPDDVTSPADRRR